MVIQHRKNENKTSISTLYCISVLCLHLGCAIKQEQRHRRTVEHGVRYRYSLSFIDTIDFTFNKSPILHLASLFYQGLLCSQPCIFKIWCAPLNQRKKRRCQPTKSLRYRRFSYCVSSPHLIVFFHQFCFVKSLFLGVTAGFSSCEFFQVLLPLECSCELTSYRNLWRLDGHLTYFFFDCTTVYLSAHSVYLLQSEPF